MHKCPRKKCGGNISLTTGGKIFTHKLPDGWRTCGASGYTFAEAEEMNATDSIDPVGESE